MANKPTKSSTPRPPRKKIDSFANKNAEAEANTQYESGLIPLLWLAIPFALVLLYGFLG